MTFIVAVPNVKEDSAKGTMKIWDKNLKNHGIALTHWGFGELHNQTGKSIGNHLVLKCEALKLVYGIYKRRMRDFTKEVDYEGLKCLLVN